MSSTPPLLVFTNNHNALNEMGKTLEDKLVVSGASGDREAFAEHTTDTNPDIVAVYVENFEQWTSLLVGLTKNCSVIAVKGSSDVNESELYQIGVEAVFGDDVSNLALSTWVLRKLEQLETNKRLQADAQSAAQTANIAMTNSSELGRVIHFVESTFDLHSTFALANGIFQLLQTIGLSSSINFRWANGDEDIFSSDGGVVGDAEKLILQEFCNDGRIIDFSARTLVNYPKVSLLIQNMPIEDEESYGRVKDLLPIILGAVNEKVAMLDQERTMYANSCETVRAFHEFQSATFELTKAQNDNNTRDLQDLSSITQDVFHQINKLGLDEQQDSFIQTFLRNALDKIATSFQDSATNTADLLIMIEDIKALSGRLEIIAESFAPKAEEFEPDEPEVQQDDTEYDFEDDDIILF